jgi:hypothetical protein
VGVDLFFNYCFMAISKNDAEFLQWLEAGGAVFPKINWPSSLTVISF